MLKRISILSWTRVFFAGFCLRHLNSAEEALTQLDCARAIDPESPAIQLEFARVNLYLRRFVEARAALEQLLSRTDVKESLARRLNDLSVQYHYRHADLMVEQRNYNSALQSLEKMVDTYEKCMPEYRDQELKGRMRKAFPTAIDCSNGLADEPSRQRAEAVLEWLRRELNDQVSTDKLLICTGVIDKLLFQRNFGFIHSSNGDRHFFHRMSLVTDTEWRELRPGDQVQYRLTDTAKGACAVDLRRTTNRISFIQPSAAIDAKVSKAFGEVS